MTGKACGCYSMDSRTANAAQYQFYINAWGDTV